MTLISLAPKDNFKIAKKYYERAYGIEVSTKKSKIMVNSRTNTSADITINGGKAKISKQLQVLGRKPA
ncbi:hypothetical protein DPMN_054397 [Dreissena polymorpha]|uniref:Uncharacterized protein n=1 Tax=Dreissena polymorpha TaxID=45954 RepID=A0A9D4HRJ5_DREPO|nr:hypothetical protein DPMN_054397 [Dreissena polymorpha]